MQLKEYLKSNILLTDGAFGTYYAQKYGHDSLCERANINSPERVHSIHADYIRAGAKLIRTNTFAANKYLLSSDEKERSEIIKQGYLIAKDCAEKEDVYVAADIGPIGSISNIDEEITNDEKLAEYKAIIDEFLSMDADIFIFETMTSTVPLDKAVAYLKQKKPEAYVVCQFALHPDSHTGTGISLAELFGEADKIKADAIGLNCASGPVHVLRHIKNIKRITKKTLSALPNASFPERAGDRMNYSHNEKYFADLMGEIAAEGAKIIGGCCGTTPGHIALIKNVLEEGITLKKEKEHHIKQEKSLASVPDIPLLVEVSPPLKSGTRGLIRKIENLKEMGVTNITLPDSPLGRARMNPLMTSCLIREKCGMGTISHLCCRDRNVTALRSDILAAWALGLRHVLCVTGDPVAAGSRDNIKSVFNLTGTRLIELIRHMNAEFFKDDPIKLYAAIDFSVPNFAVELKRAKKKKDAGADVFLSQPVYTDEAIENIKIMKEEMDAEIFAGVMPPVSLRNALFLKNEVPGIRIPDELIAKFENEDDEAQQTTGIKYSVGIAKRAMKYADGIYLMLPFGKISVASEFFDIYNRSV